MARAAGIGPRPMGAGGAVAVQLGRAAGHERRGRERLTGGTGRRQGPVGSDWVREGVSGSGAVQCGALTGGPGITVPPGSV
jgi:hypothetical protein